jgi:UDP-N-acetylglucosamine 2-epimerase (non-hydrolysing)
MTTRLKVLTLLGTRPEIIRLSRIMSKLDDLCEHTIVHTGQNYDARLKDLFFEDLGVRNPDHFLNARGSFGEQVGAVLIGCEQLMQAHRPDRILILGDTTSGLGAIVAKRLGIPVFHMEAGNRCFDDRVPEEVNRRIIDHSSDVLLPYTERSRQNLLREGIDSRRIYVTGNPILEVIRHNQTRVDEARIHSNLGLEKRNYFLVTLHRAENVDVEHRLRNFLEAFDHLQKVYNMPVIVSTHPRTRARLASLHIKQFNPEVRFLDPFGFFDFIALEKDAFCVLSDSGTVQEECALFGTPNVTLRDVTERPETLECGSNVLAGSEVNNIEHSVRIAMALRGGWRAPTEYLAENVSETIIRILTSYLHQ